MKLYRLQYRLYLWLPKTRGESEYKCSFVIILGISTTISSSTLVGSDAVGVWFLAALKLISNTPLFCNWRNVQCLSFSWPCLSPSVMLGQKMELLTDSDPYQQRITIPINCTQFCCSEKQDGFVQPRNFLSTECPRLN